MSRLPWDALPYGVRSAVEARCGDIRRIETASEGTASDFAGTLHLDHDRVFCKAVEADNRLAWMHRNEVRANPWVAGMAPRLLWEVESDGWLVLGFEHVDGRHANLSPRSADLPLVAQVLSEVHEDLTPAPPMRLQRLRDRWVRVPGWSLLAQERRSARVGTPLSNTASNVDVWCWRHIRDLVAWEARAPELIDGSSLIHTDLTRYNLLIEDEKRVRIIDWAWPARGAAWVDTAFLVIRLVEAGHTIDEAEAWAATMPVWREATDDAVTAFSVAVAGLWLYRTMETSDPGRQRLTEAAITWMRQRAG